MPLPKNDDNNLSKQQLENWELRVKKGVGRPRGRLEVEVGKNNRIYPSITNRWLVLPYALLKNFTRFGNIFFLAVALIMLINPDLSPYFRWIMIFPLLFYTMIFVYKELYISYLRDKSYNHINSLRARVYLKKGGENREFIDVEWTKLKPGDIIQIKRDEVCPADVVILNTSLNKGGGKICWADTQGINGFTQYDLKKCVQGTKNVRSIKDLMARLQYEPPTQKLDFKGSIKIDGSFHTEQLSMENFILRGSIIRNTDFVDAICVYTGQDTKVMMNTYFATGKQSYFEKIAEKFFLLGLFIVLVITTVSTTIILINQDDYSINVTDSLIDYKRIFYFFILYSPYIPVSLYAIYDLILLFKRINIHRTLNTNGQKNIKVLDPNALPSLGQVDYVLLDKSGTLTTADYKIKRVVLLGKKNQLQPSEGDNVVCRVYQLDEKSLYHNLKTQLGERERFLTEGFQSKIYDEEPTNEAITPRNIQIIVDKEKKDEKPEKSEKLLTENVLKPTTPTLLKAKDGSKMKLTGIDNVEIPDENPKHERFHTELERCANQYPEGQLLTEFNRTEGDLKVSPTKKAPAIKGFGGFAKGTKGGDDKISAAKSLGLASKNTAEHKTPQIENLSNADFVSDFCVLPDRSQSIDSLLKTITLCHTALSPDEGNTFITPFPVESTLLNFAKHCGKTYVKCDKWEDPSEYTISNDKKDESYQIIGINEFSYARKRSSIVYKSTNKTTATIVVKGTPESMKPCLSMTPDEYKLFDQVVSALQREGLKIQVLAKKDMSAEASSKFEKEYKNFKSNIVFQGNDLEELANQYEKALNFVGIVALEDELREGAVETVQVCREAAINVWMVTGDNRENAMNVAFNTGIINKDLTIRMVHAKNEEDAKKSVKTLLDAIKGQYEDEKKPLASDLEKTEVKPEEKKEEKKEEVKKEPDEIRVKTEGDEKDKLLSTEPNIALKDLEKAPTSSNNLDKNISKMQTNIFGNNINKSPHFVPKSKLKYALVIDGDSFENICRDRYANTNFAFVCALAFTIIAYRFTPKQKEQLVKMIKNRFPKNPIVMAIGDGLNDSLMLQTADIGVEFRAQNKCLPAYTGDIQIESLKFVRQLLLIHGRNISEKVEGTLHYVFYCAMYLGLPIFFYNFYVSFNGTPLFDSMLIFMYSFWFTFFAVIIYATFDKSSPEAVLNKYPALYIDGRNKKNQLWLNFFILSFLQALVHSIITFFVATYTISNAYSKEGWQSDFGMNSLAIYFTIAIVTNFKLYWSYNRTRVPFWILFVFALGSLCIYIVVHNAAQFTFSDYAEQTAAIFHRAPAILTILFLVAFISGSSYFIRHYIVEAYYPTLYEWGSFIGAGKIADFSNKKLLEKADEEMDLAEIATPVFYHMEDMDNIVAQMISPADDENLALKRFSLEYKNRPGHEKRYNMIIAKQATTLSRILYPVAWLAYGGYLLGQSILEEQETYSFSRFAVFLGFFVFGVVLYVDVYRMYYFKITGFYIFLAISLKLIYDWTRTVDTVYMGCALPILTATVFNVKFAWILILHIIHLIVWEVRLNILFNFTINGTGQLASTLPSQNSQDAVTFYQIWSYAVIGSAIHALVLYLNYKFEKERRTDHYASSKLLVQQSTSGEILSLLLPEFVKDKYEQFMGGKCYKEMQDEPVAMLFCEVLNFHNILKTEGSKVVPILDEVFRQFDQICRQYGIQKIETVGSSYVACAGLKAAEVGVNPNLISVPPVRRLLFMALDMVSFASTKNLSGEQAMKIWVGIHYGKCAAGVIGYHKPQFSLIGDTVNTTSRVCILKTDGKLPAADEERLKSAFIRMSSEAYNNLQEVGGTGRKGVIFEAINNVKFKGKPATTIWIKKEVGMGEKESTGKKGLGKFGKILQAGIKAVIKENAQRKTIQIEKLKQMFDFVKAEKEKLEVEEDKHKGGRNDEDDDDDEEEEEINLRPSKYFATLDAYTYSKVRRFHQGILTSHKKFYNVTLCLTWILYLVQTILEFVVVPDTFNRHTAIFGTRLGFLVLLLPAIFMRQFLFRKRIIRQYNVFAFIYGITCSLVQAYYTVDQNNIGYQRIQLVEAFLLYLVGTHTNLMNFVGSVVLSLFVIIDFYVIWGAGNILHIDNVFFFMLVILANLVHVYIYTIQEIELYNVSSAAGKRDSKQEFLVSQLLPKHAREKFFGDPNRNDIVDEFHEVTMLYTDIKGFTEFSNNKDPSEVVEALGALYTRFDELVFDINKSCKPDEPKLYKLYTIGDAYIVLSFLDSKKRDKVKEAYNIVKIALSMRIAIEEVKKAINYMGLQMRLGIHTGSIVGGIVGTDIVRYDIYGVDSKIANEMEAASKEGKINVSEDTKIILESVEEGCPYTFEENEEVVMEKYGVRKRCWFLEPI